MHQTRDRKRLSRDSAPDSQTLRLTLGSSGDTMPNCEKFRYGVPGTLSTRWRSLGNRAISPNRKVATLFGTITLWRYLYQPLHGVEPSIFPLEIRLGLEVGLATPALTERVGQAAVTSSQNSVLEYLKRNHGVSWSVATLRKVIAGLSEGMEPHRHDASVAQVLKWLEQAHASQGGRKPVLAVGRDGLMLPIRGETCYREGATATVSVHDRKGRRLGTVYLGRMPEPGQETLSRQLTAVIEDVLRQWNGPLPRLAYITDGGNHQTQYFRRVLKRMRHPRRPGQRLKWEWVIDYYHASEYIYKLAEALFSDAKRAESWARKMCRWLKKKPRGIYRVLHSAAAIRRRRFVVGEKQKQYHKAYDYLRKRIRFLDYCEYRRNHLPIGSGVTEAACKTVFTRSRCSVTGLRALGLERFSIAWMPNLVQRKGTRRTPLCPPLARGEKDQTPPTFPPCEGGGRGGESRGACNASENRSRAKERLYFGGLANEISKRT